MHYRLSEIEVTRPLPAIEFAAGDAGAALLLRYQGRPIGFLMRDNGGKRTWAPEDLSPWIASELKTKIVEELIRDELASPRPNVPFPSLSVAICTRNRAASLDRCLRSLLPLRQKNGFELLVIDNAPSDDVTAELSWRRATATTLPFARNSAT
ncbi:MAG: glycosyltransferase family 2 protein [Verrucomicrobia bacterium]|nr:glycosyltransferase family 2 protein [Verrucomicrobiota bacterium]